MFGYREILRKENKYKEKYFFYIWLFYKKISKKIKYN